MKRAFMVRDIDPELWKKFKASCAFYGVPIGETFLRHIQNVVDAYMEDMRMFESDKTGVKKGG